jgi:hypothetical protein
VAIVAAKKGAPSPNPRGRPKGSKSRAQLLRDKALEHILSGKKAPLEFLLTLMTSEDAPLSLRIDAAKVAAPYVHKRMPIQIENSDQGPFRVFDAAKMSGLSETELLAMRQMIAKVQPDAGG